MFKQTDKRRAECSVWRSAVCFLRWATIRNIEPDRVARRLGIAASTLKNWMKRWRTDQFEITERGRPAERSDVELRNQLMSIFALMGPHIGLPTLREMMPDIPKNELIELMRRYRYAFKKRKAKLIHALRWQRPGAVWAMDNAEPPKPIDGIYSRLLLIKDLSSGKMLMSIPCKSEDADTAIACLKTLFEWYGPPLVIKSDNGTGFKSDKMKVYLEKQNVLQLFSPPGTPAYNGSVEAGVGGIKTRAVFEAARNDRPGLWTCDDIEAARCQMNLTKRVEDHRQPTPNQLWKNRLRLSETERELFNQKTKEFESTERKSKGYLPDFGLNHYEQSKLDRVAISKALIKLKYLFVRRRRITPTLKDRKEKLITQ